MKQEIQHPKSGSFKQKTKGAVGAEASHNKMAKQTKIHKGENIKSLSSVKSNLEKLNTKLMTKKSKEINLDSVRSKEEKSQKRKKEDEQKKPNSNSIISPTPEAKRRKDTKLEPEKKNSGNISLVQLLSKSESAESRKPKPNTKLKKPKATAVSVKTSKTKPSNGTTAQKSVKKGKTTSKSEQGKKKQKESGSHEELKPNSPNSKVEARAKNHDSFSMRTAPSRTKDQTQNATLKGPRLSSHAHSFKTHQAHMDEGKLKNSKATKREVLTSLVEKSRDPSLRRLKIMRALGLIPPAASPFMRTGARV